MALEGAARAAGSRPKALRHIPVLDLWRAISIMLVLCGHLLPLGPSRWGGNSLATTAGMAIFFCLSGFLITRFLIENGDVRLFLIRRIARIVPLAWLGMALAMLISQGSLIQWLANFLFFANLPPFFLVPAGGHFWSLCVEVQFYFGVAALVALGGQRTLLLLPFIGLLVTGLRIMDAKPVNIVTWYRIDEIMAGATLALVFEGWFAPGIRRWLARMSLPVAVIAFLLASHPQLIALNYARPWLCALMVGTTLYNLPGWIGHLAAWKPVIYVARTSYALYVFHMLYAATWLGSGEGMVKYAKRPLVFGATWLSAHLSTYHYEAWWQRQARRLTRRS